MEGDNLEDPDMDGEGKNKIDLREVGWGAYSGSMCLRIGTGGGFLCIRR
jgi:hypothetical protein